jgi:hypothetical protein
MKGVLRVGGSLANRWEFADRIAHRFRFSTRGSNQLYWSKQGGKKDHTTPTLRQAVQRAVDDFLVNPVAQPFQRPDEITKDGMFGDHGNVLHRHQLGPGGLDQS